MKNPSIERSVIYTVYPTSFYDSNGDGIGDLNGIAEKLEYIRQFADLVWINPIYRSPFRDGGYDVSDYYAVDERFGTMDDLRRLLARAEALGMKILLDLVAGHTSCEHKWFQESKKKEKNAYSDYYIWTDDVFAVSPYPLIRGDGERNGGYMTNFFYPQPALNFGFSRKKYPWQMQWDDERLEPLHEEVLNIMRFYLGMGVAGFRVDLAPSIVKDDPSNNYSAKVWKKLFGAIRKEYPDAIFVSEWGQPFKAVRNGGFDVDFFTHEFSDGYNKLFRKEAGTNVNLTDGHSYFRRDGRGDASEFFAYLAKNVAATRDKGYVCVPSGNHDLPRVSLRRDEEDMKVVFAFLFALPCIPLIYYGDEIGMTYNPNLSKDGGYNRTGSRTPMQWSAGKNAGFSAAEGELYLPVNEDYAKINVEEQAGRKNSLLHTVKQLAKIRRECPCLGSDAAYEVVSCGYPLIMRRKKGGQTFTAVINPSDRAYAVRDLAPRGAKILYAQNASVEDGAVRMGGVSALWYQESE